VAKGFAGLLFRARPRSPKSIPRPGRWGGAPARGRIRVRKHIGSLARQRLPICRAPTAEQGERGPRREPWRGRPAKSRRRLRRPLRLSLGRIAKIRARQEERSGGGQGARRKHKIFYYVYEGKKSRGLVRVRADSYRLRHFKCSSAFVQSPERERGARELSARSKLLRLRPHPPPPAHPPPRASRKRGAEEITVFRMNLFSYRLTPQRPSSRRRQRAPISMLLTQKRVRVAAFKRRVADEALRGARFNSRRR